MAAQTSYTKNKLIGFLFQGQTMTMPTQWFIGLMTAASAPESGTVTEVSGSGYARVEVDPTTGNWNSPVGTNGTTSNINTITFPTPTGTGWGTINYVGIWDASSGGNLWFYSLLVSPRSIPAGVQPQFTATNLSFQIDS
jgi:hypothetical protein